MEVTSREGQNISVITSDIMELMDAYDTYGFLPLSLEEYQRPDRPPN